MTLATLSPALPRERYYVLMADAMHTARERDPISEYNGRATVPMGRGFNMWTRFNNADDLVWGEVNGKPFWMTRKQADLYALCRSLVDAGMVTMRSMAQTLNVSPSTVSRGMVKLASLGLIAYRSQRGKYAGMIIMLRVKGDTLQRYQDAAKAKVRQWREAAERRLSRLRSNVASIYPREVESVYGSRWDQYLTVTAKGATLDVEWTAAEIAESLG